MSALPTGALVLVTGSNGFLASWTADVLLSQGYRVRGTVRSEDKGIAVKKVLDLKYGSEKFAFVVIPDMAAEGAFVDAIKGVDAVAHMAADVSLASDPYAVLPQALAAVYGILDLASKEPSVKRFVLTSSYSAVAPIILNDKRVIDAGSWNEEAIALALAPPPYDQERSLVNYMASKVLTEQAIFAYARNKKPHFEINTVLPAMVFGPSIDVGVSPGTLPPTSTGAMLAGVYHGQAPFLNIPVFGVDVRDVARLHVIGLTDPDVKNERLFGFSEPGTWNDVLDIGRNFKPDHTWIDNFANEDEKDLRAIKLKPRADELLKKHFGAGLIDLKQMVEDSFAPLV